MQTYLSLLLCLYVWGPVSNSHRYFLLHLLVCSFLHMFGVYVCVVGCVCVHMCMQKCACVCLCKCVWVCLESDMGFFLNCSHLIHWGRVSQLNPSFQCPYHSCCGILCLCLPTDGSRAWESMGPVMYCVVFPGVMRDALDIQHDPEPWRSSASFHRWRNWGTGKFSNLRIQVTDQLSSEPTSEHLFI